MRRLIPLLWLMVIVRVGAGPLRLTTWNMGTRLTPADDPEVEQGRLSKIVAVLKPLDADVILLQGVRDRQMCERLAELMRPASYRVVACSTFTDPLGDRSPQV